MGVRREKVVLDLEDNLSTGMARAAAATALLDRGLRDINGTQTDTRRTTDDSTASIDRFRRSADQSGPAIDRFSGRLAIMAKAALVLGPSLVPIGAVAIPAITGLASSLGFAAIGMGSLVVASQGVGDALKAMNDAALEPTAANLDKAREAMSRLGPDAQEFVSRFQELRPVLGDIRDAAAAGWFPGLTESLDSLEVAAPRIASLFQAIGETGGALIAEGAEALAGPAWSDFFDFVEAEAPEALEDLGYTVGNVTKGLAELWMAFGPLNSDFSDFMLNAARGFEDWADGLSETQGFQDFVTYIRTEGPQVQDTLTAIADAVISIIKAASPLGGPVLAAFEVIADTLRLIADSPAGAKIFTMAAAFVVLNKTLAITAALLARTGFVGAAGAIRGVGPAGGGGAGATGGAIPLASRVTAARTSLSMLGKDMRTIGTTWATVGRGMERQNAPMNAALNRTKNTMASFSGVAAKGAAGVGAFAVATGAMGQGLELQNTAMLALVGSMAGPWGAAVGAGIGLVADASAANKKWEESIRGVNAAIESGDVGQLQAANDVLKERRDRLTDLNEITGVGDFFGDMVQSKLGSNLPTQGDADELVDLERKTANARAEAERAALAHAGFSTELTRTGNQAGYTNAALLEMAAATKKSATTAWAAFDAHTQLGAALADAREAARQGARGLDANTKAGRENREALAAVAGSWSATKAAMEANNAPARKVRAEYDRVRGQFIRVATAMTGSRREAIKLANQLEKPMTVVIREKHREAIASAQAAIAALRRSIEGKPITQLITIKKKYGPDATVGTPGGLDSLLGGASADGSTVPKDGGPYRDKYLYMLAPGEEVISNRSGQADRHRSLLKAINAGRLAEGGTVRGLAGGGTVSSLPFADLPAYNLTTLHLGALNKVLAASTKALEREKNQRDAVVDKMKSLKGDVAGKFRSDLFGESNPWNSSDTGYARAMSLLQNDTANARGFKADVSTLKRKGLDGAALADLLRNGDAAVIDSFASQSKAALARYERAYNVRASVTASAGTSAANAAHLREAIKANAELRQVVAYQKATIAEIKASSRSSKRGAGSGARNRKRG